MQLAADRIQGVESIAASDPECLTHQSQTVDSFAVDPLVTANGSEYSRLQIQAVQSAVEGAYPQLSPAILQYVGDMIIRQCLAVVGSC